MTTYKFNRNDKIGIIANDAGAANLIMGWILHNRSLNYYFCLSGPAEKIFREKNLCDRVNDLEKVIKECNIIITGTSFDSLIEHRARLKAKKSKILNIAVIDHWVNYELRFTRNKKEVLPDIIWVFDEFAEKKAKNIFKNIEVQKKENYYIKDLVQDIHKFKKTSISNRTKILYVLEPFRKTSKIENYLYEYEVLDFFIKKTRMLKFKNPLEIRLRLHPSEEKHKYNDWIKMQNKNYISVSFEKTLAQDISWADIVVGYDSYALVVANAASRICFSSKLPNEENCKIMIKDLQYIRDIN